MRVRSQSHVQPSSPCLWFCPATIPLPHGSPPQWTVPSQTVNPNTFFLPQVAFVRDHITETRKTACHHSANCVLAHTSNIIGLLQMLSKVSMGSCPVPCSLKNFTTASPFLPYLPFCQQTFAKLSSKTEMMGRTLSMLKNMSPHTLPLSVL